MRTTLDLAEDVLQAAREQARREHRTLGETISELARRGLQMPAAPIAAAGTAAVGEPPAVYGLRPFPRRGGLVTNERIDQLREDDAY